MTSTVQQLAERYGTTEHTVLGWIRRGELAAIDVSREPGGRPRWRITPEAIEAFELRRTHQVEPPRKRRKVAVEKLEEFF